MSGGLTERWSGTFWRTQAVLCSIVAASTGTMRASGPCVPAPRRAAGGRTESWPSMCGVRRRHDPSSLCRSLPVAGCGCDCGCTFSVSHAALHRAAPWVMSNGTPNSPPVAAIAAAASGLEVPGPPTADDLARSEAMLLHMQAHTVDRAQQAPANPAPLLESLVLLVRHSRSWVLPGSDPNRRATPLVLEAAADRFAAAGDATSALVCRAYADRTRVDPDNESIYDELQAECADWLGLCSDDYSRLVAGCIHLSDFTEDDDQSVKTPYSQRSL